MAKAAPTPEKPEKAKAPPSTTERVLKYLALVGAVVSLFGYGVVLGLSSAINLDHGSMLVGAFDLLSLVWPGVMVLVTAFDKINFWTIVGESFSQALPIAAAAFVTVVSVSLLKRNQRRLPKIDAEWIKRQLIPDGDEPIRTTFRKAVTFAAGCFAVAVSAPVAGVVVIFLLMVCLLMVPLIGYGAGQGYFAEYVLKPERCTAVVPGDVRLAKGKAASQEGGATCAVVTSLDPTKHYASHGRVVLSSSAYMLMYHKESGVGERIPVAGLVIRSIDDDGMVKLEREEANKDGRPAAADVPVAAKEKPRRTDGASHK